MDLDPVPPMSRETAGACPGCGAAIPHTHPYSWCSSCGAPLPHAVNTRLTNAYSVSAGTGVKQTSPFRAHPRRRASAVLIASWVAGFLLSAGAGFVVAIGLATMVPHPDPSLAFAATFIAGYGGVALLASPMIHWGARVEWPAYAWAQLATVLAAALSGLVIGRVIKEFSGVFVGAAVPAMIGGLALLVQRRRRGPSAA